MRSKLIGFQTEWHYADACLRLQGIWQTEQVSVAWQELSNCGVQRVDLSRVSQIDSSLIALLVHIRTTIDQTLLLSGVSSIIRALLQLYEVEHLFFEVIHHDEQEYRQFSLNDEEQINV